MRTLGTLSSSISESLPLQLIQGQGFISVIGTFNGSVVAVQFKDSTGSWKSFTDGDSETADFQYRVDAGGAPIDIRAALLSGTPTGDLTVNGGSNLDWKSAR